MQKCINAHQLELEKRKAAYVPATARDALVFMLRFSSFQCACRSMNKKKSSLFLIYEQK
jgi:hypothetical protein